MAYTADIDIKTLPEDLQRAVDYHGHLCPGVMIGWRAARAAQKALGVTTSSDEELVAVVENDSCSVDAFQALLSTTFGKGNFKWLDHGKQAFTVTAREKNQAVRILFRGDHLKDKRPDGSTDRLAYMNALLTVPDEEILEVTRMEPAPPAKARIEPSLICSKCGESTQESRTLTLDGKVYCRACAPEK
jgi:formylmethanofuran dehydrogenase subunit E